MHRLILWVRGHDWVVNLALVVVLVMPPAAWARPAVGSVWTQALLYAFVVGPLFWRRRYPRVAAGVIVAAAWTGLVGQVWGGDLPLGYLSLQIALYTLVLLGRRRAAVLVAVAAGGLFVVRDWLSPPGSDALLSLLVMLLTCVAAWLLAEFLRARRGYLAEVEQRAALAESEREALGRAGAAEERARIARELHDILAHSISVIVVNAEGAQLIRDSDPDAVDRTFATISATGRSALAELRRLLDVMPEPSSNRAPQPSLADLPDLVARAGVGRRPISLDLCGDPQSLPASAALQVYRTVQEAVTNVLKHAPTANAVVRVDLGTPGPRRLVVVEVTNTAPIAPAPVTPGGRGLAGIRARVALYGGTLSAAPTDSGGFRVEATFAVHNGPQTPEVAA